ncbi:ankyrin repeat domain-containing protein SOWAHA [Eucyclogobius newberryi]|uniref:ankyrin repeat domain-containing protein SOWAHA n=1 Tax=Eucyclogobius newberryi TaxID=166745 RepID=UPI003B5B210A
MALTQESVLSFLLEHGGKVKNSDFLNHFRSRINANDPAEKQHNRDLFKKFVNSVAVVKTMDETKFVVVKNRYLDFLKDAPRCASPKAQTDDSFTGQNASFSYQSPHRPRSVKAMYSDIENNNRPTCVLNLNGNYVTVPEDARESALSPNCVDATTLRVLNIPGHQRTRVGKAGSVFAVVAVKSPPTTVACKDELHQETSTQDVLVTKVFPTKVPPSAHRPAFKSEAVGGWGNRQADDVVQPIAVAPVRPPQSKNAKQGEDTKYCEAVPLDPVTHEWLVECAAGLWGRVYALLLQDIHLIQRKDFMSGFTVLHWAAKKGNCDMMRKIMDIARKRGASVNINVKAHGGYTPLHIAAIHGHTKVLFLLVQGYRANVNVRDNDGKKASHYLGNNVLAEVKVLLGAQPHSNYGGKKDEQQYKSQSGNKSTITKRFHSQKGKKHRATQKCAQNW